MLHMNTFLRNLLWVFAGSLGLAAAALAQQAQVTSTLQVEKVVTEGAKTQLLPAEASKPGDVLEYRASYDNRSATPAEGLAVQIPIPAGTTYLDHSAEPANAQASVDGVHFADMPLMRDVKKANGGTSREPVPLADYRVLRWKLGTLSGDHRVQVRLRVKVNPPLVISPNAASEAKP